MPKQGGVERGRITAVQPQEFQAPSSKAYSITWLEKHTTMAHQRTSSTVDSVKEPHSVSLKVLRWLNPHCPQPLLTSTRLSRPSLSVQHPLPLPTPSPSPTNSPSSFPAPSASLA